MIPWPEMDQLRAEMDDGTGRLPRRTTLPRTEDGLTKPAFAKTLLTPGPKPESRIMDTTMGGRVSS